LSFVLSARQLYTACKGQGAFLNGSKISGQHFFFFQESLDSTEKWSLKDEEF
jgi:fructose-1,6-bisphosphatase/inositol monophosphatase family enzyme